MASSKKSWRTAIVWIIGFFLIIVAVRWIWNLVGFPIVYSEGDRVGQIVKLSEKGLIWKTWEGGMGLTQSGAYVEYWNFSVDAQNPEKETVVTDLKHAFQTGQLVKIRYEQRYGSLPWRSQTPYFIKEVSPLREK